MDETEARHVLQEQLAPWRRMSHAELAGEIDVDHHVDVAGASGATYQVEIQVLWETEPGNGILVLGSIDDGSFWRACKPLTDSLVVYPDRNP